jgi:hypothetical protein
MPETTAASLFLLLVLLAGGAGALLLRRDVARRAASLRKLGERWARAAEDAAAAAALAGAEGSSIGRPVASLHRIGQRLGAANHSFRALQSVEPLYIVYAHPKTGCSTLEATLAELDFCRHRYSAHFLSAAGLARLERRAYGMDDPRRRPRVLRHFRECCEASGLLKARELCARESGLRGHPWARPWVVTSVREPVSQLLSDLFYDRAPRSGDEVALADLEAEARRRLERLPGKSAIGTWLESELEAVFDVDPLALPFSAQRGWVCGENERVRFLLTRLESFDRLPEALGAFFGIPPESVRVVDRNRASDRPDHEVYAAFQRSFRLSPELARRVYGTPYVRHFYSEDEIGRFVSGWTAPVGRPVPAR